MRRHRTKFDPENEEEDQLNIVGNNKPLERCDLPSLSTDLLLPAVFNCSSSSFSGSNLAISTLLMDEDTTGIKQSSSTTHNNTNIEVFDEEEIPTVKSTLLTDEDMGGMKQASSTTQNNTVTELDEGEEILYEDTTGIKHSSSTTNNNTNIEVFDEEEIPTTKSTLLTDEDMGGMKQASSTTQNNTVTELDEGEEIPYSITVLF